MLPREYIPEYEHINKAMVFVDGENLSIRYKEELGTNSPSAHIIYQPDVYVWSNTFNRVYEDSHILIRTHYYTSVTGDDDKVNEVIDILKSNRINSPRVFKKLKGFRSKKVDISLATEMLAHAHRNNYELAILIAGDADYIPLVEAVRDEGKNVVLWFLESGLSKELQRTVDHYININKLLFAPTVDDAFKK